MRPFQTQSLDTEPKEGLTGKIERLLISSGAFAPETEFINIDRVWQEPKFLDEFSACLGEYIRGMSESAAITGIVATETVQFPFGCVPLAACIARESALPLVVWEESSASSTGESCLSGLRGNRCLASKKAREGLLIFQEAVRHGTAVVKCMWDLKDHGYLPKVILTIVDTEQWSGAAQALCDEGRRITGREVRLESITSVSKLRALGRAQ